VPTTVGRVMVSVNDFPRLGQSGDAGSTLHECSQIRHLSVLHDQRDMLRSVEASWLQEAGDGFLRSLVREPDCVGWRCKKCKSWERYSPRTNRVSVLAVDVVSDVRIQKLEE
jgi:hypothetical protein